MVASSKSSQLQIRVSPREKAAIQKMAKQAGMEMSAYVLSRLIPSHGAKFNELAAACVDQSEAGFALAEMNSYLSGLGAGELRDAVASPLAAGLSAFHANYIAAMVEYACGLQGIASPAWTREIEPLSLPVFGTELKSLRLYLLTHSPPPFRKRNIFIDASIGSRV